MLTPPADILCTQKLVGGTGHYLNFESEGAVAVLALLKAHSRWRG